MSTSGSWRVSWPGSAMRWTWSVEARSVNGRNLEVRYRGPNGFDELERLAKTSAQARFARGQVTLGLQARRALQESLDRRDSGE